MGTNSNKLDKSQKRYLLQRLSWDDTPQEVADAVKAISGLESSRQGVRFYGPRTNFQLSEECVKVFEEARSLSLAVKCEEMLNRLAYRQRRRSRMLEKLNSIRLWA